MQINDKKIFLIIVLTVIVSVISIVTIQNEQYCLYYNYEISYCGDYKSVKVAAIKAMCDKEYSQICTIQHPNGYREGFGNDVHGESHIVLEPEMVVGIEHLKADIQTFDLRDVKHDSIGVFNVTLTIPEKDE